jgi:hypothetical protein
VTDEEIVGIILILLGVYFYLWGGIMMVLLDPAERPTRWRRWRRRLAMWLFWPVLWPYDAVRDWLAWRFPGRYADGVPLNPPTVQEPLLPITSQPTIPKPTPQVEAAAPAVIDPQVIANIMKEIRDDGERKRIGS